VLDILNHEIHVPFYLPHLANPRSKHYMAFIRIQPCVVCLLNDVRQQGKTTAHHIESDALGAKGPDWHCIPVEDTRHMDMGSHVSIERHGKKEFLERYHLPPYENMVLIYLGMYVKRRQWEFPLEVKNGQDGSATIIQPEAHGMHSACYYFEQMKARVLGQ
jgi:hypothetical protein